MAADTRARVPAACSMGPVSGSAWRVMPLKMKRLFLLLVSAAVCVSCAQPDRPVEFESLGPMLDSLTVEHSMPRAAFAVFDDAGLRYEHLVQVSPRGGTRRWGAVRLREVKLHERQHLTDDVPRQRTVLIQLEAVGRRGVIDLRHRQVSLDRGRDERIERAVQTGNLVPA